jgi:aspartyl-tRNA(Asn)/glutamyl-tRNA(Gln) amidotransferase subunit A
VVRTLIDAATAVQKKELSPVELVEGALERAARWQPVTNAFSQLHAEEALEEAQQRAHAVADGEALGPLHGVPVAVKDLFDVVGWETSGSSLAYRGQMARTDAMVVRRLRAAGAIVMGKTNQHELAAGGTSSISSHGPTRNPWNPQHITGGSSGGSAAAVASRVVALALGSDTGGSIRIPASFCGVVGLKPTHVALPVDGMMSLAPSLDTPGALTTTAEDAALAFRVLTGLDEAAGTVEKTRIGILGGFFGSRTDPEVLAAVDAAGRVLSQAGAEVGPVVVEGLDDAPETWSIIAMAEFAGGHGRLLRRPETLYPTTRNVLEWGARLTAVDYLHARERAVEVRARFLDALSEWDILLAPATLVPAPLLGAEEIEIAGERMGVLRGAAGWLTRPISLTGLPTLSLPVGFSRMGLPLGAQLVGRDREEWSLLRIGMAYQERTDHHLRAPEPRPARTR